MREWILPRPLVDYLEALDREEPIEPLIEPVEDYLHGLEQRMGLYLVLLAATEEAAPLQEAWESALGGLDSFFEEASELDELLQAACQLADVAAEISRRAQSLPRVTGSGTLDELFLVGSNLVEGCELPSEAIMAALVAAKGTVTDLERRGHRFLQQFPQEPEILAQLESALEYLRSGLGGVFLSQVEELETGELELALRALVKGGNMAVACLAAMGAVEQASFSFSRDPVLESLHRAWKANKSEAVDAALVALEYAQETLQSELKGLRVTFAPADWRSAHIPALESAFERAEAARGVLVEAFEQGNLQEDQLIGFRTAAAAYDDKEAVARDTLPDRHQLPDVGHFVALIEMMGAVFERRAPFFPLEDQLLELVDSFRDYAKHLERLYDDQAASSDAFEELLTAVEEVGETLDTAQKAVEERDSSLFPTVWEELTGPLELLDNYATQYAGETTGFVAKEPLLPFFEELRLLLEDRSRGLTQDSEFQHALGRAEAKTTALLSELKAGVEAGSGEAIALGRLTQQLAQLYRNAKVQVGPGELAEVERLGMAWQKTVPSQS